MAKIQGVEFPINNQPERGPGVESWENRKENNNNEPFSSEKMMQNFEANKTEMFDQIRKIL